MLSLFLLQDPMKAAIMPQLRQKPSLRQEGGKPAKARDGWEQARLGKIPSRCRRHLPAHNNRGRFGCQPRKLSDTDNFLDIRPNLLKKSRRFLRGGSYVYC
jgi:hypothetical protein